ncbi:MAG: hypothetical protein J6Y57_10205, partial [Lachnospiraceae bacterium]|nr:hypothetical protein [Lachnospiraceae bacterium]
MNGLNRNIKRILEMILAVALIIPAVPQSAFAEELQEQGAEASVQQGDEIPSEQELTDEYETQQPAEEDSDPAESADPDAEDGSGYSEPSIEDVEPENADVEPESEAPAEQDSDADEYEEEPEELSEDAELLEATRNYSFTYTTANPSYSTYLTLDPKSLDGFELKSGQYTIPSDSRTISAGFYVADGYMVYPGQTVMTLTARGTTYHYDYEGLYSYSYSEDDHYFSFSYDFDIDDLYRPITGNVSLCVQVLPVKTDYKLTATGNIKLNTAEDSEMTGLLPDAKGVLWLDRRESEVNAQYVIDPGYMIPTDSNGNLKVSATVGGVSSTAEDKKYTFSCDVDEDILTISVKLDEKKLPNGDYEISFGDIVIQAECVPIRTNYTLTSNGNITINTDEESEKTGLILYNGSYYIDRRTDEVSAEYIVDPDYIIAKDPYDNPKVSATVGGVSSDEEDRSFDFSYTLKDNILSVKVDFGNTDLPNGDFGPLLGDIVVQAECLPIRTNYTLTSNGHIAINTDAESAKTGLILQNGVYYLDQRTDKVSAEYIVDPDYIIAKDPNGDLKVSAMVGGVSSDEEDRSFNFSYTLDDNILSVTVDFGNTDLPNGNYGPLLGDIVVQAECLPIRTNYTLTSNGHIAINTDAESAKTGLILQNGVYYLDQRSDRVEAEYVVETGYKIALDADGLPKVSATVGGVSSTAEDKNFSFSYDLNDNILKVTVVFEKTDLPESNNGIVLGNIVINAECVPTRSVYELVIKKGNIKLDTRIPEENVGFETDAKGKNWILDDTESIHAWFKLDADYIIKLDEDDKPLVTVSVGGVSEDDPNALFSSACEYEPKTGMLGVTVEYEKNGATHAIGKTEISVECAKVTSKFTFTLPANMTMDTSDPANQENLVLKSGKWYVMPGADEVTAVLKLNDGYVIKKVDGDWSISAKVNNIAHDAEGAGFRFDYDYDREAGRLKVTIRFATDDNGDPVIQNAAITADTYKHTLSGMTFDETESDTFDGLQKFGTAWCITGDSISATFKAAPGRTLGKVTVNESEYDNVTVTVGGTTVDKTLGFYSFTFDPETGLVEFSMPYPYTYEVQNGDESVTKVVYGDVKVTPTFITNRTLTAKNMTFDEAESDSFRGIVKDGTVWYIYDDRIEATFQAAPGRVVRKVTEKDADGSEGEYDNVTVTVNGRTIPKTDGFYDFSYDSETGMVDFSMRYPYTYDDKNGNQQEVYGPVVITPTFDRYTLTASNMTFDETEAESYKGLMNDGTAWCIMGDKISATFQAAPGRVVRKVMVKDADGREDAYDNVSVTIGNTTINKTHNAYDFSYDIETGMVEFSMPYPYTYEVQSGDDTITKVVYGSVSVVPTFEKLTLTASGMTFDETEADSYDGLVKDGAAWCIIGDRISAKFKATPGRVVRKIKVKDADGDYVECDNVSVTVGGTAVNRTHNAYDFSYDSETGMVDFSMPYPYSYDYESGEETYTKLIYGSVVVTPTFDRYTLTASNMTFDETKSDSYEGLMKDGGWCIHKDRIKAVFQAKPWCVLGTTQVKDAWGDLVECDNVSVAVGGTAVNKTIYAYDFSYDSETGQAEFSMSYPYTYTDQNDNEVVVYGAVSVSPTLNPIPVVTFTGLDKANVAIDSSLFSDQIETDNRVLVSKGEELIFTVEPKPGYVVSSVKNGSTTLKENAGKYTIASVNGNITINIAAAQKQPVPFNLQINGKTPTVSSTTVTQDGVSVALTGVAYNKTNKNLSATTNAEITAKVTIPSGKLLNEIYYLIDDGYYDPEIDVDGKFIIPIGDVEGAAENGVPIDLVIKTANIPVGVSAYVDGEEGSSGTARIIFGEGVEKDDDGNYLTEISYYEGEDDGAIEFDVAPDEYKDIQTVTYRIGTGSDVTLTPDRVNEQNHRYSYSIPGSVVKSATDAQQPIRIDVSLKDRECVLTFNTVNYITYNAYTPGGSIGATVSSPVTVKYKSNYNFVAQLDSNVANKYEISRVSCNGAVLSKKTSGNTEYYSLTQIRSDCTIDVELKYRTPFTKLGNLDHSSFVIDPAYAESNPAVTGGYIVLSDEIDFSVELRDSQYVIFVQLGTVQNGRFTAERTLTSVGETQDGTKKIFKYETLTRSAINGKTVYIEERGPKQLHFNSRTGVSYKAYVPGEGIGETITDDFMVPYESDYSFVVELDEDCAARYELTEVKVGDTVLQPQTEGNVTYYTITSIKDSRDISVDLATFFTLEDTAVHTDIDGVGNADIDPNVTNGYVVKNEPVTFTLTSNFRYAPLVQFGHLEDGVFVADETAAASSETVNKKWRTCTYQATRKQLNKRIVRVLEQRIGYVTLTVDYDDGIRSVSAKANGTYYADLADAGSNKRLFSVPDGKNVTLIPYATDHYQVGAVTDAEGNALKLQNGTVTVPVHGNTTIHVASAGVATMFVAKTEDKGEPVADTALAYAAKGSLIADADAKYELRIMKGTSALKLTKLVVKNAPKDAVFAQIDPSGDKIVIDTAQAAGATKAITLTVNAEGENAAQVLNCTVVQNVTSVDVKGFKNHAAEQPAGTSASYTVTLNTNAKYSDVSAVLTNTEADASVAYDASAGSLTVQTYKGGKLPEEGAELSIVFKDRSGNPVGDAFVIRTTAAVPAAPTVKAAGSDDVSMVLSLGLPKGMGNYVNLYYMVEATAEIAKNKTLADGMVQNRRFYVPVTDTLSRIDLTEEHLTSGNGAAQKYNITASIIQLKVAKDLMQDPVIPENGIFVTGKTAKASGTTKQPAYESKLALTKKTAAFTAGEENVTVAAAKFTATTTYTGLKSAEIKGALKKDVYSTTANPDVIGINAQNEIVLKKTDDLWPGQYTLTVSPIGEGKSATLALTVKAPVTGIRLTCPSTRVYKGDGKPAAVKITAACVSQIGDQTFKPASAKLTWSVSSGNTDLKNAVQVKNGAVTVDKAYVLKPEEADNEFTVTATADDLGEVAESVTFRLSATALEPVYFSIGDVTDFSAPLLSTDLEGKKLVLEDAEYDEVDLGRTTITVAPKGGLTIDPDGTVHVAKA